jgi:hypothetical protein
MADDNQDHIEQERRAGYGIDPEGGKVVDPTKNVLDLVRAESKYQDGMRESLKEMQTFALSSNVTFQNFAREAEAKLQTWMRDSETKRVDQLWTVSKEYEKRIADILSDSVKSNSQLVATQLLQIQSTFDARVSKLEEFRLVSQGRSSVSDPALAQNLVVLQQSIETLANAQKSSIDKMALSISSLNLSRGGVDSEKAERGRIIALIFGAAGFVYAAIMTFETFTRH